MKFTPGNAWNQLNTTEHTRLLTLTTALEQRGMLARRDSRLSYMYAKGDCTDSVDSIADELIAVEFLHQMTSYGVEKERVFRRLGERLRQEYGLPWNAVWDIVRFYAPCMLKMRALQASNQRIPYALSPLSEDRSMD